ncbi:MAG: sigma factor-like helix-turn-helix DNA-binding protein, partial [bacterium]
AQNERDIMNVKKEKGLVLTASPKIEKLGKKVANMTQAELARAVGVSRERIRQLVPRMKVKPARRVVAWHQTIPPSQRAVMIKMYESGASLNAIAKKYGVSEYHVREVIRQARGEDKPRSLRKRSKN